MIELTRFDGSHFYVNAEFIEFVETTPDTIISLIDHKKLVVREKAEEVIARIIEYQTRVSVRIPPAIHTLAIQRQLKAEHNPDHDQHSLAYLNQEEQ